MSLADANPGQTENEPPISKPRARTNLFTSCYFRVHQGEDQQLTSPPDMDPVFRRRRIGQNRTNVTTPTPFGCRKRRPIGEAMRHARARIRARKPNLEAVPSACLFRAEPQLFRSQSRQPPQGHFGFGELTRGSHGLPGNAWRERSSLRIDVGGPLSLYLPAPGPGR
jgi:hypothetical protein